MKNPEQQKMTTPSSSAVEKFNLVTHTLKNKLCI